MARLVKLVIVLLTAQQVPASPHPLRAADLGRVDRQADHAVASYLHNPQGGGHTALVLDLDAQLAWATRLLNKGDVPTSTATVNTSVVPSGTVQILGSKKQPILTNPKPKPTPLLSPAPASVNLKLPFGIGIAIDMASQDIFANPICTHAPPANIGRKQDHPVPRLGITSSTPIPTNKFYANFFLGNQTFPTFLHPYSVSWARGQGASGSWGLAISHVDASQRVYGQVNSVTGAAAYYLNPIGIQSLCISAAELGSGTTLTTDSLTDFSVRVSLRPNAQAAAAVQFPLVQGSAFITAIFNGATPLLQTGVFYRTVTRLTQEVKPGVTKYRVLLENGVTWLVYAYHTHGGPLNLQVINNGLAQAQGPFYGIIQVAKDPGSGEAVYDQACGAYPTGVKLTGSVAGTTGSYTFAFQKAGMCATTLAMFALPHHQSSFDDATRAKMTGLQLQTTTKGDAAAVIADSWTMVEADLPTSIAFLPWSPTAGSVCAISGPTKAFIHNISLQEVSQDMLQQTNKSSMYFSGKALAKFAAVVLAVNDMLGDQGLAQSGLRKLKVAFSRFSQNSQQYPLVYESAWGGVVSSATYTTGDKGADFGNTLYNDHNFHWGYFIYTAAVIGHLDPSWIPANLAYVNMLARDIANPSTQDPYFPVFRCFDWFHGHSWAHGLYDALDGKDQESSSEDTMHAYALKMWGAVSGNQNMEAIGNLILAVQARSMQDYYLYTSRNKIQPPQFIGNKVAGILFENKVDHTTWFGANIEYIQGIHMLPLLPHTPRIRTAEFVAQEWNTYFSGGRAEAVAGGWKGILFGNYATVNPRAAYAFFSRAGFDPSWLDGGASRTWYLCYAAALGGL